jgi:hypothetical protein
VNIIHASTHAASYGFLQELREEVFMKVERLFLCGLRSNNPEQRARFLQLYQKTIAINLYDRMDWVVTRQEWSNLANQFWLKQVGVGWGGVGMLVGVFKRRV